MKTAEPAVNGRAKDKGEELNGTTPRPEVTAALDKKKGASEELKILPLRQAIITIPIQGIAPLKLLRFSQKQKLIVMQGQEAGSQAGTKKRREPKDFERNYEEAKYKCSQVIDRKKVTWLGLNATGIRNGCIETCRIAGLVMTKMKMSIFCQEDGFDDLDRTPLCRIFGEPEMSVDPVRNANGSIDLRARVMFPDWRIVTRLRFDEDQVSPSDVLNLMIRVGQQNGLGEGRPNGTNGSGTGNGLFKVEIDECSLERLPQVSANMFADKK